MKRLVITSIVIVAASGILGIGTGPAFALNPQPEPPTPVVVSIFNPKVKLGWNYLNPQPEPPMQSSLLSRSISH